MKSKIRFSSVGAIATRVSDSVQPVHSWNDSQITDCRRAAARPSARASAADGRQRHETRRHRRRISERRAATRRVFAFRRQGCRHVSCGVSTIPGLSSSVFAMLRAALSASRAVGEQDFGAGGDFDQVGRRSRRRRNGAPARRPKRPSPRSSVRPMTSSFALTSPRPRKSSSAARSPVRHRQAAEIDRRRFPGFRETAEPGERFRDQGAGEAGVGLDSFRRGASGSHDAQLSISARAARRIAGSAEATAGVGSSPHSM